MRAAEEARRQAVEEALEQLLARDTQYRKELRSHLDTRMEIAKKRRSFHRQQYKEVCTTSVSTSNLDLCASYFLRVTSADFERHIFKGSHFRSFFSTSLLWTVNTRKEFSRDWIKSIRKASTRRGLCVRPSWKSTARPRNSQTSRTDISRD